MYINSIQDQKSKDLCQHSQLTLAPICRGEVFFFWFTMNNSLSRMENMVSSVKGQDFQNGQITK